MRERRKPPNHEVRVRDLGAQRSIYVATAEARVETRGPGILNCVEAGRLTICRANGHCALGRSCALGARTCAAPRWLYGVQLLGSRLCISAQPCAKHSARNSAALGAVDRLQRHTSGLEHQAAEGHEDVQVGAPIGERVALHVFAH